MNMQVAQPVGPAFDLRVLSGNELAEVSGGFIWIPAIIAAGVLGLGVGFFFGVRASGRIYRTP
jgi:hypothetical protein